MKMCLKIFFSLAIFFSLNLFPSWENDYLLGLKKFEKKDYFEAVKLFEKAIKNKPNSCEKCIREGMFFYDYYPHFYLAKCYLALNEMENFQSSIEFLKSEGKIQNNSKLGNEFFLLQQSLKKEEKIAEKPKEEKIPEKPKEEKKEPPRPPPMPKVFQEIAELEGRSEDLSIQDYPKLYLRKMELSGELIFLKKKWNESKNDGERSKISQKASQLKTKFEKLINLLLVIEKIKTIKENIAQRIDHLEKNKEQISKEDFQKVQKIRDNILRDIEDLDLNEMEDSYKIISEIKIQEKKLEFKNLKMAYSYYFQGKFDEAERFLKNIPDEEKLNPHFDFLISLINLTKYYLNEKKDKNLLNEARDSLKKAKEKGLKTEDIKKIPISPKLLKAGLDLDI